MFQRGSMLLASGSFNKHPAQRWLFFNQTAVYIRTVASWADADGFVCCLVSAVDAASGLVVVVILVVLHIFVLPVVLSIVPIFQSI